VSRGLGQRQLGILRVLASCDELGKTVEGIAEALGCPESPPPARLSVLSSTRRSLATLELEGSVRCDYYLIQRGRPQLWTITDMGRWEL
jgi:hypothetical protein